MRISPVGYYPGFVNTAMYVGNMARSALLRAGVTNQNPLSPVDSVPKVFSNAETERIVKTPEEMQHDREVAMAILKGKTPREAENLNPLEDTECETCENRKYVDGSDEGNVSFKAATHIAPESAASAVLAHEYQHVRNAMREDQKEDAELVNVSVSLKTAICPECGTAYVAGGETRTTMRYTAGGGEKVQQPE